MNPQNYKMLLIFVRGILLSLLFHQNCRQHKRAILLSFFLHKYHRQNPQGIGHQITPRKARPDYNPGGPVVLQPQYTHQVEVLPDFNQV